ncbi:hypothetical protein BZG36_02989 [Bifiguratus adelaidae]|uniref:Uncharacterized protein n=1 Tax=Bifiguratus adelaidae TaxID=1938954 RepID=A0A261XYC5_9FUNG|nr:hypothetical protein BZG36_02989 [Bifiguratus adelaidae]
MSSFRVNSDPVGRSGWMQSASVSDKLDPYPHFFIAGACGVGSYIAYNRLRDQNLALVAGGIGLAYLYSGYLIGNGEEKLGYRIATGASLALAATAGPKAYDTSEPFHVALASLSAAWLVANSIKAYDTAKASGSLDANLRKAKVYVNQKTGEFEDSLRRARSTTDRKLDELDNEIRRARGY